MHGAWSQSCDGLVEQAADYRSQEFLGRTRLRLLGRLTEVRDNAKQEALLDA